MGNLEIIQNFQSNGYLKFKLFSKKDIKHLKDKLLIKINYLLKKKNINLKISKLKYYHKQIINDNFHSKLMNPNERFLLLDKPIVSKLKNKKMKSLLNLLWGHKFYKVTWIGDLRKKQIKFNATGFRIARPENSKVKDVADMHLDLNAGGIINRNNYNSLITIWIPLEGFNKKYTLNIAPGSHLYRHENCYKKSNKISVLLTKSYCKKYKFKRLEMKPGEVIFFHPNLIHGGSKNLGKFTRVSLDVRLINLFQFK